MHLTFRNVNDAFKGLVGGIADGSIPTERNPSRVGDVLVIPEPVTITYMNPRERVLFNPYRDANPFFHLFESLWMLAGEDSVAPLSYYNSKIGEIASDDGETFNGAYGYRWRSHAVRAPFDQELKYISDNADDYVTIYGEQPYFDQLDLLVSHLRKNPSSRRAVLQMWTVADDLLKVDKTKDVCCNVCAFFSIRDMQGDNESFVPRPKYLDMTVINRSNDIVWGMLGANVVHFSFLQEYLACRLGVKVGVYNQFSNNAHVYTERFEPQKWFKKPVTMFDPEDASEFYESSEWGGNKIPLVRNPEDFDREVKEFVSRHSKDSLAGDFSEPFLREVAEPMSIAYHYHKRREYPEALAVINAVGENDWMKAGKEWIERRRNAYEVKGGGVG